MENDPMESDPMYCNDPMHYNDPTHNDPTYFCRVCGLEQPEPQYGEDGEMPTYDICPCCSVVFGYGDITIYSTKKSRERWIRDGMKWFHPEEKPENWSWEEQKKSIPEDFR